MALTNSIAGRNLGMLLLGLWLILTGLLPLLSIRVSATVTTGLAVLAIVAGILIILTYGLAQLFITEGSSRYINSTSKQ